MNLIIILLMVAVILVIYCIFDRIINGDDGDDIIEDVEDFSETEGEMPSMVDCKKYPELCYSYQYINDKHRPYLFGRKEYWNRLDYMRHENRRTWRMRELERLAAEKRRRILAHLASLRAKFYKLVSYRSCRRRWFRRRCRTRQKFVVDWHYVHAYRRYYAKYKHLL